MAHLTGIFIRAEIIRERRGIRGGRSNVLQASGEGIGESNKGRNKGDWRKREYGIMWKNGETGKHRRKAEGEVKNQALSCCISSMSSRKLKIYFHANNSQLIYTGAKYSQMQAASNHIDQINCWLY